MDLGRDKTVGKVISRLAAGQGPVNVEGTWGSFARLLSAHVGRTLGRPILHICPHIDDADKAADDLHTFSGQRIDTLPAWEGMEDLADATDEIRAERLRLVSACVDAGDHRREPPMITASVQALCQPVPAPRAIAEGSLELAVDADRSLESLTGWLVDNGFERVEQIDLPGQFARRGGIIDIYAPLMRRWDVVETAESQSRSGTFPAESAEGSGCSNGPENAPDPRNSATAVRVEFFGDTIESIRIIHLDTHLSTGHLRGITLACAVCGTAGDQRELFLNTLPIDTIIVLDEPASIEEVANLFLARVDEPAGLYTWRDIHQAMQRFDRLHLCRFATGDPADWLKAAVRSVEQFQHKATTAWTGHKAALEDLVAEARRRKRVYLYCESPAEVARVGEIVREINGDIPSGLEMPVGYVSQGFQIDSLKTIVISHHELFGQFTVRRRQGPIRAGSPIDSLSDLQVGDYVVHASYGIGKFLGIETIAEHGGKGEYLTIEYADRVRIQVSVRNIHLVQKYIGTSPRRPNLSRVGSKKWQKQKDKVAASVADLAAGLLDIQAKRQALGGIAYGPDSNWQREFEESFAYQETPDQTTAVAQIKADMQQPIAMDRLLCGDVGYGKTELAMRAAFKTVENGKQVAVLVPTTVLCIQHGRTFAERFADFPMCIEVLNRFRTASEAADVVARAKDGRVDILIGTHRLLSRDIAFKDLGLLIIDEEQRFGVRHKEQLKALRVNVDILTMTATPIPRTLHMAMLGIRDISSLATPPLDRRSIVTSVAAASDALIRKAVLRELNRQGQVFFLHNRVKTIEKRAWQLQKLIPEARMEIAHGQMSKSRLEKAMIDFVTGRVDVLVCTTIIESGLDIPNANTIIIDDADRFGLAELHQLRGRVGRYKHRAYAYMLMPSNRPITPIAAKRLKAIEEYSHLGAGFRIALRDLEIRGAGNILGPEQSGHIQTVGYQMYCELLANAVRKLKGEPVEEIPRVNIDLGFAAYIPRDYIPIDRRRLDVYRKIAVARGEEDLRQISGELTDVYGPIPQEVQWLCDMALVRIRAARRQVKSIVASGRDLIFSFSDDAQPQGGLFASVKGRLRMPRPDKAYLTLNESYFEPATLLGVLRKVFRED